jgi:hypothetical protein
VSVAVLENINGINMRFIRVGNILATPPSNMGSVKYVPIESSAPYRQRDVAFADRDNFQRRDGESISNKFPSDQ